MDMREEVKTAFFKNIAEHQMTVLRDDGIYRHLKFSRPGSNVYRFDLVTWPGYLCFCGEMGEYVFSRVADMFEFFRTGITKESEIRINPSYWAEKCLALDRSDGVKKYSPERFREVIQEHTDEWIRDHGLSEGVADDIAEEIHDLLAHADDGEALARQAAEDFDHHGLRFEDLWETDLTEYTYRFLWCLYAIVWGIQQHDEYPQQEREVDER